MAIDRRAFLKTALSALSLPFNIEANLPLAQAAKTLAAAATESLPGNTIQYIMQRIGDMDEIADQLDTKLLDSPFGPNTSLPKATIHRELSKIESLWKLLNQDSKGAPVVDFLKDAMKEVETARRDYVASAFDRYKIPPQDRHYLPDERIFENCDETTKMSVILERLKGKKIASLEDRKFEQFFEQRMHIIGTALEKLGFDGEQAQELIYLARHGVGNTDYLDFNPIMETAGDVFKKLTKDLNGWRNARMGNTEPEKKPDNPDKNKKPEPYQHGSDTWESKRIESEAGFAWQDPHTGEDEDRPSRHRDKVSKKPKSGDKEI